MSQSKFVYVTYIRTTPEKLWDALTKPEFTRVYWYGTSLNSTWEKGAPWKMVFSDGRVADSGEVLEVDKPRRLVLSWINGLYPELTSEGFCRCTFEIETAGETTKLTVIHEKDMPASKMINAVSGGWPKILASLKSLLETDKPLPVPGLMKGA